MARPLSLCATAGASRHPVLPYTPDSENLLSAAECSSGLTLLRLRPLATERGSSFRSDLQFPIKAKPEHRVTLPCCGGNFCAKHVRKRSKTALSHYHAKIHGKSDTLASHPWGRPQSDGSVVVVYYRKCVEGLRSTSVLLALWWSAWLVLDPPPTCLGNSILGCLYLTRGVNDPEVRSGTQVLAPLIF